MPLGESDFLKIKEMIREESDYVSEKIQKSIADSFVHKLDYLKDQQPLRIKIYGIYAAIVIIPSVLSLLLFFKH